MVSELNILSKDKLKKMGHPDRKKKTKRNLQCLLYYFHAFRLSCERKDQTAEVLETQVFPFQGEL